MLDILDTDTIRILVVPYCVGISIKISATDTDIVYTLPSFFYVVLCVFVWWEINIGLSVK